jgi:alpha-tubulin suppressor-like RCC1 family protein
MALSVGENHVAAITVDGELYSAGRDIRGSLGHANKEKGRPARVGGVLEGKRVVSVACGTKHTLALADDGNVYAWGDGKSLALGQGEDTSHQAAPKLVEALRGKGVVAVYAGNGFSVARTKEGSLYSWGSNEYGQLGQGRTAKTASIGLVKLEKPVAVVSCGDLHVLAVSADGTTVFSFGSGADGRTGLGNDEHASSPQEIPALSHAQVAMVAAGGSHSLAVTKDNRVFTWGKGRHGQLGQVSLSAARDV